MKIAISTSLFLEIYEELLSESSCLLIDNSSISVVNTDSTGDIESKKILVLNKSVNFGIGNNSIILRKETIRIICDMLLTKNCHNCKLNFSMNTIELYDELGNFVLSRIFTKNTYQDNDNKNITYVFCSL